MTDKGVIIYLLADNKKYIIGLSDFPEVDIKFYLYKGIISSDNSRLFYLNKPLNLGLADHIFQRISTLNERKGAIIESDFVITRLLSFFWEFDTLGKIVEEKLLKLKKILNKFDIEDKLDGNEIEISQINKISLPEDREWKQIYQFIQGRKLYYSEIRQVLRQNRITAKNLDKVLAYLKLLGKLEVIPSLSYIDDKLICQRCGNEKNLIEVDCNYCQGKDYYCKECILMGESRLCRSLYLIPSINYSQSFNIVEPTYRFNLTPLQQVVSDKLIDFLYEDYQQALVWAVCGAGKTEVSFEVIADTLSRGGKVLFAIPRKDVVIELAERLKEAFPEVKVKALYGGSELKYKSAKLVVATTHQVLRYYQAFELIILDEMDAFPYKGSDTLKRALHQAKKPKGKLVYMTATPSEEELTALEASNTKLIKLSARYHGHPLPEPEFIQSEIKYDKESKKLILPKVVIEKIKLSVEQELYQVFIFLPSRELVEVVTQKLAEYFPDINGQSWVQGSHSQDRQREEKRESFLAGDYPILVSTTIMERGVTVEKANVMVLFADWEYVFSEETLIQMAGRSGRSLKYPQGKVWFVGESISGEMEKAREKIKMLNEESAEKGYLKSSGQLAVYS
ncbi:DNA/RNA helicase [Orenia metallireducens]|uniref:DNA/RNA helicase n=1 Tax=Orenia metallireducens TaxID=1413210 RepID=A0A1C0ABA0_9FIRM|nr:DEAD/DEAH box helicase [Orenia metallireducens]OCL27647.1 DNA/RNA helicase [Orenia metallireducens]